MILLYLQMFVQTLVSPETTSYSYELAQKTVQEQVHYDMHYTPLMYA